MRTMLESGIHRAAVTRADLHHVGPVTVHEDLLDAAEGTSHLPRIVHGDGDDRVVERGADPAAASPGVLGQVRGDLVAR